MNRWTRKFRGRAVLILGLGVALVVVVVLLLLFLDWYIAPNRPGERKDLVLAAAQVLGGTALLSGLYFTWRTLQTNREGQITDRFTKAIDQLGQTDEGNKVFEIRLGGIYALKRISTNSEEDYWPIMEILTAYVRQHSKDSLAKASTGELPALDPDIQAIITVLKQRTRYFGNGEPAPLDLHGANLQGAHLAEAHLEGALLSAAHLERAILIATHLEGADLSVAHLEGAMLWETHLEGAILRGTHGLSANVLATAFGDEGTVLPYGIARPIMWSKSIDEQREVREELEGRAQPLPYPIRAKVGGEMAKRWRLGSEPRQAKQIPSTT